MRVRRGDPLRVRSAGGVVVGAAILLMLATGFCLFDDDGTAGQGRVLDVCLGVVALALAVMSLAPLPAIGWAMRSPASPSYVVARGIPHPPPRPALFL